ncbi:MAG: hypothetical protein KIT87_01255 [Anaerolineae bacterium]|nr:hypothetical protein [Anaerolineae bacterium]
MPSKIGLDSNRPVILDPPLAGAPAPTVADPQVITGTGAAWVRLNFVLAPWTSPDDQTRFQGRTWEQFYRQLVNQYRERGLRVYGLINHEAAREVPGDFFRQHVDETGGDDRVRAEQWVADYAQTFGRVFQMFQDSVDAFESFNEPDDWHGGDRNWIHPAWFAVMLQAVHDEVRGRLGLRGSRLISGPLQGLNLNEVVNNNGAAGYLNQAYQFGRQRLGWGQGKPFPFEGVGYHLYITQVFDQDWNSHALRTQRVYRQYVDQMMGVIRRHEGPSTARRLFVSEIGWPAEQSDVDAEDFQARSADLGVRLLADDPAIAVGIWFCTQDFDFHRWGLYRQNGVTPDQAKPALEAYRRAAEALKGPMPVAPEPGAEGEPVHFTHQDLINAVIFAGNDLGVSGFLMLARAGLNFLLNDRQAIYTGLPIDLLPNLSDTEKEAIKRNLPTETRAFDEEAVAPALRPLLTGKGVFILNLEQAEKGDAADIVGRAQMAGLTHVVIKVADGPLPAAYDRKRGDLAAPVTTALQAAGRQVWGLQSLRGQPDVLPVAQALTAVQRVKSLGLDGLVITAGPDYEDRPRQATAYMEALRANLPLLPVALSSYRFVRGRRSFPWREFLTQCDLYMPQVLWGRRDPGVTLTRSLQEHSQHKVRRPIFPTGGIAPSPTRAGATAPQLRAFLQAVRDARLPGANLLDWRHLTDAHWDVLSDFEWTL